MSNNIEKQKAQRKDYEKRRKIHKNNYKARYGLETTTDTDGKEITRIVKFRKPLLSQMPGALPKSRKFTQPKTKVC